MSYCDAQGATCVTYYFAWCFQGSVFFSVNHCKLTLLMAAALPIFTIPAERLTSPTPLSPAREPVKAIMSLPAARESSTPPIHRAWRILFKCSPLTFASVNVGQQFGVSQLVYHNGETTLGTSDTVFPVHLDVVFTAPTGFTQTFSFTFDLTVTPNNASPISNPANDDILSVPVAFAPETFVVGSNVYTLELLGFQDSHGVITSTFDLPEESNRPGSNLIAGDHCAANRRTSPAVNCLGWLCGLLGYCGRTKCSGSQLFSQWFDFLMHPSGSALAIASHYWVGSYSNHPCNHTSDVNPKAEKRSFVVTCY